MATILVLEEDPELGVAVAEALAAGRHDVVRVADGRVAVAAIETLSPDLIVLDVGIPGLGGLEVIRRVRDRRPDLLSVPVIVVAAARRLAAACEEIGTPYALAKPCSAAELRAIAERALEERRPPRPDLSGDAFVG